MIRIMLCASEKQRCLNVIKTGRLLQEVMHRVALSCCPSPLTSKAQFITCLCEPLMYLYATVFDVFSMFFITFVS